MFSQEESKKIRQEFWTSFGKEYPHKWLLYNTRIKEIELKFTFEDGFALVSLDIISKDEIIRAYYYEKLESLKTVLKESYLPEVIFVENYRLPEGKTISRIYVEKTNVKIHSQKDWPEVKSFFASKMLQLEEFFTEFKDFIES